MSADAETIAFYNAEARTYADQSRPHRMLGDFIAEVRPGGCVLDLGCGAGADSAALRDAGFRVTSIDASAGLAFEAKRRHALDVRVMRFDELDYLDAFDGVYASASLHHARAEELTNIFAAIHRATRIGGVFQATLKMGEDRRDRLGRFYCAMSEEDLAALAAHWRNVRIEASEGVGFDGVITPWLSLRATR